MLADYLSQLLRFIGVARLGGGIATRCAGLCICNHPMVAEDRSVGVFAIIAVRFARATEG